MEKKTDALGNGKQDVLILVKCHKTDLGENGEESIKSD